MQEDSYYTGKDLIIPKLEDYITNIILVDIKKVEESKLTNQQINLFIKESTIQTESFFTNDKDKIDAIFIAALDELEYTKPNVLVYKSFAFNHTGLMTANNKYVKEMNERADEYIKDVEEHHNMTHLPSNVKSKIHSLAYDKGHSHGHSEVTNSYFDFVELAQLCLD
jgi:hypothetical protein